MRRLLVFLGMIVLLSRDGTGADESRIDRSIGKQPTYQSQAPTYALLVFGRNGDDRVWPLRDGDTLFVDRNGNGDLTESGESVKARKTEDSLPEEEGYFFEVGELTLSGRTHKALTVSFYPLSQYFDSSLDSRDDVVRALKHNPRAFAITINVDAEITGIRGGGLGGRVGHKVGPTDLNGLLQFGKSPQTAPVIRIGGPLQITFFSELPKLVRGRTSDFILVVGSPGIGSGTFSSMTYEETIPESAYPLVAISFQDPQEGGDRQPQLIKLRERC